MSPTTNTPDSRRYAAMFAALGHEARVEVLRLLLAAHPVGMVAGEIQQELEIPASTLSHHLDALHREGLVEQSREGRFLRYTAGSQALQSLLDFLYAECCTRRPDGQEVVQISLPKKR
ncbi:MAG: metalloregulator ArsR/SmtB family transcription factor [Acidobacteriota bacterium]|nr:metalloregulator ArsR/SmtB family transcription factor [Acidobacteriota bacterium]